MRLALLLTAVATAQIETPRIGIVRDDEGSLRQVAGVRGAFLLGAKSRVTAISAAFTGTAGVVKTAAEVLLLDERGKVVDRYDAPPGPALFAFRVDGALARLHFSASNETVVALGETTWVVRRGEEYLWVDIDGAAMRVEDAREPMLMLPGDRLVHRVEGGLAIRRRDGAGLRVALDFEPRRIELMGRQWLHVAEAKSSFAVRIDGDTTAVHELPRR